MPTVAYLGPENTNTHAAALARFGRRSRYAHAPTVDAVFHLVERRQADYGVVPIENSLEGAVTHTLDRFIDFLDTPVTIHGEIEQPIQHALILRPKATLERIRVVISHPQALGQCRAWLAKHLPRAQCVETRSTAEAIQHLVNPPEALERAWAQRELAAIGRADAATERTLRAVPIPQDRDNKTRFLVIGLGEPVRGRRNKTSAVFSLKDRPGALYDALLPFKREGINLTKIESRPSKRKAWEYVFFIDLEGHRAEPRVARALAALKRQAQLLQVLGSYPVAAKG
jgi:chorismate mutase/prephenate dehydratase